MSRELRALPVPTRPAEVLALLPTLAAALAGDGPALLPVTDQEPDLPAALGVDRPVADRIALVIGTSGSTGAPKGALLASEAVKASAMATHARLGGPGTWLLAMSARYIGGLQVLIRSLLAGNEPVVADLTEGFRAENFTKAAFTALEAPGRHYTALVPTQLGRLMSGDALAALRGFDAIVMGGAAMPEALRQRCRDEGVNAIPSYGMSETASGCVYDGVPLDGVEIRLSDGRIDIRGPMLADGYRNFDGESPFVDGWFQTSDLGRRLDDGRLEVIGRLDDVINTGGVKVAPLLVERALTAVDGITDACVVGLPDPEWGQVVAAAVVTELAPSEEELREAVRAAAGRAAAPKLIRFVPALPLLGPGKVDRAAVRKALGGSARSSRPS
ncbi:o-succinylbenzoate--CoA ligase [Kutzneria sp. CA-103260]|uniref:o-succinylbenzoate--CoA ligase n=1 Tax=Kutzneria sp. CA-103260 TaxID=2802641 RepID=UPI001BA92F1A|nr:o-succinylbenzoate--CoA ligase [Kutzneria sp. CA-103260]QUQ70525.1 O-succinylbenzoic acid--CoA ligase [Kutzneria sp. CA-103260]